MELVNNYISTLRGVSARHPEFNFVKNFVKSQRSEGVSESVIYEEITSHIAERSLYDHSVRTIENNNNLKDCLGYMEKYALWTSLNAVAHDASRRSKGVLELLIEGSDGSKPLEEESLNRVVMQAKIMSLGTSDLKRIIEFLD